MTLAVEEEALEVEIQIIEALDLRYDLSITLEEALQVRSKIYNFLHQKNVTHVREMDLNLGLALTDVLTVEETVG